MSHKVYKMIVAALAILLYSVQWVAIAEHAPVKYTNKGRTWKHSYNYVPVKKKSPIAQNQSAKRVTSTLSVPTSSSATRADLILKTGASYLGTPYKARISGHTLDCSGLVRFIFAQHGISLPSGSYNQVNVGKTVSRSELQKGDLIFFKVGNSSRIGHVAVYVGNNKVLHTYDPGVKYDSLDAAWLKKGYVTAKRVL